MFRIRRNDLTDFEGKKIKYNNQIPYRNIHYWIRKLNKLKLGYSIIHLSGIIKTESFYEITFFKNNKEFIVCKKD